MSKCEAAQMINELRHSFFSVEFLTENSDCWRVIVHVSFVCSLLLHIGQILTIRIILAARLVGQFGLILSYVHGPVSISMNCYRVHRICCVCTRHTNDNRPQFSILQ
ncbi:hypothetical protein EDB19DRAFT_1299967 [Suillus lakei]|nr:hypothetical protein EDB19DRAFT_1299967 [Suillus lakei]